MKVLVLSDIHLESANFQNPEVERDVTIIAGDLAEGSRGRNLIDEMKKVSQVLYVMGNHEYYRKDMDMMEVETYWLQQGVLLQCQTVKIDGVKIAGCTLWTDFDKGNSEAMQVAFHGMNDYDCITQNGKIIDAKTIQEINRKHVEWLIDQKADIVVTHHSPSMQSVHPEYYSAGLINYAFSSDLEWLIESTGAKLWIHGHTHKSFDYKVGDCRVLCNPRGYWRSSSDRNPEFNPNLVIEI